MPFVHCSAAKQHAPEAAAAADGQLAGGAPDDSHDADIAAVAGTDAVPSGDGAAGLSAPAAGSAQPAAAAAAETPSLTALQPGGSSGKLLLTMHDGGSLAGTAAGDGVDAGPPAGPAAGAHLSSPASLVAYTEACSCPSVAVARRVSDEANGLHVGPKVLPII